jgi:hypothetical protein
MRISTLRHECSWKTWPPFAPLRRQHAPDHLPDGAEPRGRSGTDWAAAAPQNDHTDADINAHWDRRRVAASGSSGSCAVTPDRRRRAHLSSRAGGRSSCRLLTRATLPARAGQVACAACEARTRISSVSVSSLTAISSWSPQCSRVRARLLRARLRRRVRPRRETRIMGREDSHRPNDSEMHERTATTEVSGGGDCFRGAELGRPASRSARRSPS